MLTGAGISAESGVPTFRDAQTGLWARYKAEELASPQAFQDNPQLVWDWYTWRRQLIKQAKPNPGHTALVLLETHLAEKSGEFVLITQNVDGLHQLAGSQQVIELHGNILRTKCFEENVPVERWEDLGDIPPRCPSCGGLLRPDVVWFGESLPPLALLRARRIAQRCDVFLSIGTSTNVEPAASLPYLAIESGATVIEINPNETPLSPYANFVLRGPGGVVLPSLVAQLP